MTMFLERKQDQSVYYFIKNIFASTPAVKVVDEYPNQLLTLPTVSVENMSLTIRPFEIGNRKGRRYAMWAIDVFATSKTQRDDIAYKILETLEDNIPVYDYDQGFPPTIVPQIGVLQPEDINYNIIKVIPALVETLYWRSLIMLTSTYESKI
jgi:hypothetical protein